MADAQLLSAMYDGMAPFWAELSFLVCFCLGFTVLRSDLFPFWSKRKKKGFVEPPVVTFSPKLVKTIESESASGTSTGVLKAWRAGNDKAATPQEILKIVVEALLEVEPAMAVAELVAHVRKHAEILRNSKVAAQMLDIVARAGRMEILASLWTGVCQTLGIAPTPTMYEVLLGGYATAGDDAKVEELFEEMQANHIKPTARGFCLAIKGFLKNGMVDAVLKRLLQMRSHNMTVPPFAVAQFFRIACAAGRLVEVFPEVEKNLQLSPEALSVLIEDACRRSDLDFAKHVEKLVKEAYMPLPSSAYDPMLKLCVLKGDIHGLTLFKEMQEAGVRISEGLCVGLLARCADTRFLRFAEEVVKFVQARGGMTIAIYSALMKVYAYCNMYDKACDLYDQIRADGLEPDSMMYGCLMKFSVECGRTDLSRELSKRAPSLDIQNYMSLIRAAGRDKDVDRAFGVLKQVADAGMPLDVAAHNCVLDVCVSAGDMKRAQSFLEEMKQATGFVDIITYNTLMKGYCQAGDLKGARELLQEMQAAGLPPNDVSYNCIINAAVSHGHGNFREAWETIDLMERNGVAVDHYTISIMMKAMKKANNARDVTKALALLDRSSIDICSDEILLNTVLETCIRHREYRRLEGMLECYWASSLRPQVHTYGSLIKASSTLKRIDKCWELWTEMQNMRGMEPNDIVLGCMLDALVTNSSVDEAVELFDQWKNRIKINTVIYSTLIKGFANSHEAQKAMNTWKEMKSMRIQLNTVVYNAVIDAQARVGAMDEVVELVEAMEPDGCMPDAITHSTIVKGYCVKGDLDKAFEVFRHMQQGGMANDCIIYNTVLDGCTRHGRFDLADSLLEDMDKFNIVPSNFTLGILVKMWGRRRQLDKAFEAVEVLPRRFGFHANAQVSTCLMCACLNNGAMDRAFTIFEELQRTSRGADAKAYGALISGCVRLGQLDRAEELVQEALTGKDKVALETQSLEQLLRAYANRGLVETHGLPLVERLRAAKVPISSRILGSAFGGSQAPAPRSNARGRGKEKHANTASYY